MVWQRIFPSAGGGTMRRYLRLQKALWNKSLDTEHLVKGPVTLFDFADHNDAVDAATVSAIKEGSWRISDDEVIGGFSRSKMSMVRTKNDLELVEKGDNPEPIVDAKEVEDDDFAPFIRWKGSIDTRIGESSAVHRSGFCAIQSPLYPFSGAKLAGKYNALEFKCRSDGRQYLINLRVSTMFPGDLYQAVLAIPATTSESKNDTKFSKVIFPFKKFQHTSHGRIRVIQRELDGGADVETVGFTMMDGTDGDFEFDLASIRAVNYYDGDIMGEDDALAPY
eukprot:CAMPEP_0119012726 /NCGR_PEP_ID=MMETSP1176-20130426/7352_1 /TAXON_ID=265551 /ORGANISM="Synedropsis recta cf, Strain CCMP1620" /LENGTH=278 /DNA_ID=CAMNT_0006965739 /DNA_START=21 /DNA_END=857 /DNA_ORIENTATION=+